MKKVSTLLIALGIAVGASAQDAKPLYYSTPLKLKKADYVSERFAQKASAVAVKKSVRPSTANKGNGVISSTPIGNTFYDLQTNGTMPRRLIRYADGTMSAIWTFSLTADATTNNDRGTGYNYFDGTAWRDFPNKRIENNGTSPSSATYRSGFQSIVANAAGKEIVTGHNGLPTAGGTIVTIVSKNPGKGQSPWTTTKNLIANNKDAGGISGTWHKSAASGDNIYVICTIDGADTNGVKGGIYFARSTDGGNTFSNLVLLPGEDTTNYPDALGSADRHTIDAYDKYVVISGAGQFTDLAIWKSEDYGATFTRTVVAPFAIKGWEKKGFPKSDVTGDGVADTIPATDMSPDVILDKNGKAHIFWGQVLYYQPNADSNGGAAQVVRSLVPNKQIYYWNETDKVVKPIAGSPDLSGNGVIDMPANSDPFKYALMGFAGQPTTGIDAAGNLYLVYAAYSEGDTTTTDFSDENGIIYYNLYATKSTDGGATWCPPVALTNTVKDDVTENIFPSMARNVDGNMHIIWQTDGQPGSKIQESTPPEENTIQYASFSVGTDCASFGRVTTGINTKSSILKDVELSVYPNPTSGEAKFVIATGKSLNGTITVKDIMGRTMKQVVVYATAGATSISEDFSSLANGVYFVNFVTENGKTQAQKMIIAK